MTKNKPQAAIWGWLWCGHCHETAKIFYRHKIPYDLYPMEIRENRQVVQDEVGKITAPMVEFYEDGEVLVYPDNNGHEDEDKRWDAWVEMIESKFAQLGLIKKMASAA